MTESEPNNDIPDISAGHEFMGLYVANERRIYGLIYALVHDWTVADDLLQETAKVMWSKFQTFDQGTDFAAWALRIARYQVMNYIKTRDCKIVYDTERLERLGKLAQDCVADDRRHEQLRQCLKRLDERDRQLIALRYEVGATAKEMAHKLGRGVKTVYYSLSRIHYQLFQCMRGKLALEEQA